MYYITNQINFVIFTYYLYILYTKLYIIKYKLDCL